MLFDMNEGADEVADQLRWQQSTSNFRRALLDVVEASEGFAGAELRPVDHELIIYSAAPVPDAAAELLRSAPPGVRVHWEVAPHSLQELTAELGRLVRVHAGRIHSAAARHDGSCIEVTTTDRELLTSKDPRQMLGARYPIHVSHGERPVPA